jgi:preprotein translocase subunit SecF
MSYSLIACIVALILAAIVLIYFYRLGSLAVLSNVAVALVGTLLLVGYFSAQFGIGTLLGLAIVGISTAFGGIYYFAKLKEGVYAGKSLKKAHIDATKKTLWPNIDMGIVNIVVGLCVYGLIPGVVGKMGLVMVFGGFLGSLSNILLLRLEGWLLANDNSVEAHIGRVYGIDEKKVPNLLKEEKQTYFGSFAKVNFQKHVKPIAITSGVVLLAAIIGVSVFSGINGVAFNYSSTYDDSTSLSLEYRADKNSNATLLLGDESQLIENFLPYVSIDGNKLSEVYVSGSIDYSSSSIYDSLDEKTYAVYYFNVPLSVVYDDKTSYEFVYSFPGKNETGTYTLNDGLSQAATLFSGDNLTISGQKVVTQAGTPTLGNVYLSVGISLIALLIYFVLRYKNSRGLALSLLSCASGVIVAGFFALTRIPVSSLSMMGIIAATVFTYILGIFVLSKEKESAKESREKDKASLAFRSENLIKSTSESAGDLLNFSFLSAGVLIIFYGLIPLTWSNIYLSCFIGFIVSLLFVLVFLAPLSNLFEKLLSQIHINFHPFKKEGVKGEIGKKKSAEPEEATFIGIND